MKFSLKETPKIEPPPHSYNERDILIDDSIKTAQTLSQFNSDRIRLGQKPVLYFLNGQGPLTQPRLGQIESEIAKMKGIFLFHNWKEVPQLTKEAQLWRSKLTR